jgi:hypothetical protein
MCTQGGGALKAAELVAKHIDGVLRSDTAEAQLDALDGSLLLFRLLDDKACVVLLSVFSCVG